MCVFTYFNLPISACSKQPGLRTIQGHGGDVCVAMATVKLFDLLARVSKPADHRGGRVAADYLQRDGASESHRERKDINHQKEFDPFYAVRKAASADVFFNDSHIAKPFSTLRYTLF